ncbi:MAG: hypothetical protein KGN32_00485 [Burkholderiales bacterium]|nr:hypothetical protein [Burkholderiales bacterium]
MESARRFRALLSDLGLSYLDAAKMLHVSLRTLHNWAAGTHAVPYAVTKLLRLLRYMELPGKDWAGWHFTRGCLVSPEGRTISGTESSWWSLLILRAQSFGKLYERQKALARAPETAYSEPCTSESLLQPTPAPSDIPLGNHGDNLPIVAAKWYQSDTMMRIWQSQSGSRPKSKPSPSRTASGSESPSTGLSASPLTRIYNGPKLPLPVPRLRYSLSLNPLPQALPQSLQALPGLRSKQPPSSKPSGLPLQVTPSPTLARTSARPTKQSWPTGTGATRPSSGQIGGAL